MKTITTRFSLFSGLALCGSLLLLFAWSSPASAIENVDLKLVLATDVSGSIDNDELQLERMHGQPAYGRACRPLPGFGT